MEMTGGFPVGIVSTIHGPMFAPIDDHIWPTLCSTGMWEGELTWLIGDILEAGDEVCNVGAHVGWHTVGMARSVGETGRVVAFEPDPGNRRLLDLNTAVYPQVDIRPLAVSDDLEVGVPWGLSAGNSGDHHLGVHVDGPRTLSVDVTTLAAEGVSPRMLVVDAQGADFRVLAGAGDALAECEHVMVEFTPPILNPDDLAVLDGFLDDGWEGEVLELGRTGIRSSRDAVRTLDLAGWGTATVHLWRG